MLQSSSSAPCGRRLIALGSFSTRKAFAQRLLMLQPFAQLPPALSHHALPWSGTWERPWCAGNSPGENPGAGEMLASACSGKKEGSWSRQAPALTQSSHSGVPECSSICRPRHLTADLRKNKEAIKTGLQLSSSWRTMNAS